MSLNKRIKRKFMQKDVNNSYIKITSEKNLKKVLLILETYKSISTNNIRKFNNRLSYIYILIINNQAYLTTFIDNKILKEIPLDRLFKEY